MVEDMLFHPQTLAAIHHFASRPTHGLLLAGHKGSGKTWLARYIAAEQLGIGPEKLESYPYFRTITARNGTISIEAVRELLDFFKLKTGRGTGLRRFVLVDGAEQLTTEAQNALLKLLEEPPADSLIMLTTGQPEGLLPTVRSRLHKISVVTPENAAVLQYFTDLGFDETAVQQAWLLADSSLAEAGALLKDKSPVDNMVSEVKAVLATDTFGRLAAINRLVKSRDTASEFVVTLLKIAEASSHQAASTGSGSLHKWYSILNAAQTAENALLQNVNPKLALTELMLAL